MSTAVRFLLLCGAGLSVVTLGSRARGDDTVSGRIAYTRQERGGYYLHLMDADGKNDKELSGQPGEVNVMPVWSPDGREIAFMSGPTMPAQPSLNGAEFSVYVIHADGTGLRRMSGDEKAAVAPAWSPDGKTLLFTVLRNNAPQLVTVNADGTGAADLPAGLAFAAAGFFSPDGKQIAFLGGMVLDDESMRDLYAVNADGSGFQRLTTGAGYEIGAAGAWSPDGKTIAFASLEPTTGKVQLRCLRLADKVETEVAEIKTGPSFIATIILPSWSPDGKWLIFGEPGDGTLPAIWRMSPDGKTRERLTPTDAACFCPSWSAK
jgi:TolB protein